MALAKSKPKAKRRLSQAAARTTKRYRRHHRRSSLVIFLTQFESANGVQLSSLELESIKDSCILDVPQELDQGVMKLEKPIKEAFGAKWKEELCEGKLIEGKIEAGSPAVLVVTPSALRSIELLRGMRSWTKGFHAVKLFSKHMN
ncbi:RmlC-like cupins superfamily protein [Hibiscus syriacus]|uniref:RmlC-like cupins superfamily protein n=1 Tax=Hibiscus syriacus TaxID=106335 RepID=A0A6A3BQK4_HIBSY|nr:RmlC-like cupins superfamily protein [Hibiscus syriacus]